jgi:hypothetical protein
MAVKNAKHSHRKYMKEGAQKVEDLLQDIKECDPKLVEDVNAPVGWDTEKAWQLYAQFAGDIERTAIALNVPTTQVLETAQRLDWQAKLKPILELKSSSKQGDLERGISRAMNFSQAHRLRVVVERVLKKLYDMTPEALFDSCFTERYDKEGNCVSRTLNTKVFADLATAMEKVHMLTYAALGDTATERVKRNEQRDDAEVSASQLHNIISQAMANHPLPEPGPSQPSA